MFPVITNCPACTAAMAVTRLQCPKCATSVEGHFAVGAFAGLSAEQLAFVATFVRSEGKLNRMEVEMGLSYPTVRARLQEIIRAMGYEPSAKDEANPGEVPLGEASRAVAAERRSVLEDLDAGRITAEEAVRLMQKFGG